MVTLLYDKPDKRNFQNKKEKIQYKACLKITCAIQGTSREKLYEELGLYSLVERRWCSKLQPAVFLGKYAANLQENTYAVVRFR